MVGNGDIDCRCGADPPNESGRTQEVRSRKDMSELGGLLHHYGEPLEYKTFQTITDLNATMIFSTPS